MAIVNPRATAPLTAAQLANFRFQLFDEQGMKLTEALALGSMPAPAQPGVFQTQGAALAAGGRKKVEI
jgi:hypothetical protein